MAGIFSGMNSKVTQLNERRERNNDPVFQSLFEQSLVISEQRDETEREIKRLAELGLRDEAWALVVKHFDIKEPVRLRRIK